MSFSFIPVKYVIAAYLFFLSSLSLYLYLSFIPLVPLSLSLSLSLLLSLQLYHSISIFLYVYVDIFLLSFLPIVLYVINCPQEGSVAHYIYLLDRLHLFVRMRPRMH